METEIVYLRGIAALPMRWRRAANGLRESARHAAADAMFDCAEELERILNSPRLEGPKASEVEVRQFDWCRTCRTSVYPSPLIKDEWRHMDEQYDNHEVHLG